MKTNLYLDDIIYKLQRYGGISTFWREITSRMFSNAFLEIVHINGTKVSRYFPVSVGSGILHSSYYRLPLNKSVISILTIHDCIHELGLLRHPTFLINLFQFRLAIKRANILVCVSENTKQDLLNVYPNLVRNSDIYVIPHGTTFVCNPYLNDNPPLRLSLIHQSMRYKYILFVGKRSFYKNFNLAIKAFAYSKLSKIGFKIICIGEQFSRNEKVLFESLNVDSSVYSIANVSNIELTYLYQNAFALIYPSKYEGFGLPPLEAMSCGCPVVASNSSSIPEVVGDAGLLVAPSDVESLSFSLHQLLDSEIRNSFIERGLSRSKLFSWDIAADRYLSIYKSLV